MAKAKEITGIDCAADALVWATAVLRARFDEVIELRAEARDFSDIESVHQTRVATRRLRSALHDFLPLMKKHPLKKTQKQLKLIADALGAVRDQDVAILALKFLQSAAEKYPAGAPVKAGIETIIAERGRLREAAQANLIEVLEADYLARLRDDFSAALDKATKKKKSARIVSFNEAGREAVASGLNDLCSLGSSVYEPYGVERMHEMRIAAKRLRYAVELFRACWGASIAPFASEIAEMQTALGEVHDCDVWLKNLTGQLRGWKTGSPAHNSEYETAAWLLSSFVKMRTKHYRAALKLWSKWEITDFAGRMRETVQTA
ncbi:MAG: CHAD domain-containing protein [Pyrinomonadaceae bacterium]